VRAVTDNNLSGDNRVWITKALGALGAEEALPVLATLLHLPYGLSVAAAKAVGRIGTERARHILHAALNKGGLSSDCAAACAKALSVIGDESSLEPLRSYVRRSWGMTSCHTAHAVIKTLEQRYRVGVWGELRWFGARCAHLAVWLGRDIVFGSVAWLVSHILKVPRVVADLLIMRWVHELPGCTESMCLVLSRRQGHLVF